jgi:hypothetical protein
MKSRRKLILNPKHWIYVLCHALLIVLGFLVCAYRTSDSIWFAVGTSLSATGIAGMVAYAHVLVSDQMDKQIDLISVFGIVDAFESRSIRIRTEYEQRLDAVREKIDIMGFGLRAFREDFREHLPRWRKHAQIRILLIDPEFPTPELSFAVQRSVEEQGNDITTDVRNFVAEFGPLLRKSKKDLQIRLYRCLPSINIFRIDDELFWGPYLMNELSRNVPTLVVRRGGVLFSRFEQHFDTIWTSEQLSRDLPEDWYQVAE